MIDKVTNILRDEEVNSIFADFGQGDKFLVRDAYYSKSDKAVFLKIEKGSTKWIEIDGRHAIKLTRQYLLDRNKTH